MPSGNVTLTRFDTNVYTTYTNITFSVQIGADPLKLATNIAAAPTQIAYAIPKENGTQIITAGVTMYV